MSNLLQLSKVREGLSIIHGLSSFIVILPVSPQVVVEPVVHPEDDPLEISGAIAYSKAGSATGDKSVDKAAEPFR
jgi:hypothetical protein